MASKSKPWVKHVHNWLGLGSGVFLLALLATGVALNHPGSLVPGSGDERLSIAAHPADPAVLFRGTASRFERSADVGATWEEVPMLFPASEVVDIAFHPRDAKTVGILQRWQGPLLSRDGGVVWEPVPLPFDPQAAGVALIALSIASSGELWLETSAGLLKLSPLPLGGRGKSEGAVVKGKWQPVDFDLARKNWLRLVRTFHNGHFFGPWFVKVYDAAAVALLLLIVTGVVLWRIKTV